MNISWRLAWRNLWRHRRRTWLTVGAMVFCNVLLIFLISLQLGSYQMMIDNSLATYTGHLQVQHRDYLEEQRMRQSVPAVAELAHGARDLLELETVAARGQAFALASSEERSFGVLLNGVQPQFEPRVSTLAGLIREGRYLSPADRDHASPSDTAGSAPGAERSTTTATSRVEADRTVTTARPSRSSIATARPFP